MGAEWWLSLGAAKSFHIDKDEDKYEQEGIVVTPALNSILYLSDVGAPTVILNQTSRRGIDCRKVLRCLSTPAIPSQLALISPKHNRRAVFWSGAVHGVSTMGMRGIEGGEGAGKGRATLLINWWTKRHPIHDPIHRQVPTWSQARITEIGFLSYRDLALARGDTVFPSWIHFPAKSRSHNRRLESLDLAAAGGGEGGRERGTRGIVQGVDVVAFSMAMPPVGKPGLWQFGGKGRGSWVINLNAWVPLAPTPPHCKRAR